MSSLLEQHGVVLHTYQNTRQYVMLFCGKYIYKWINGQKYFSYDYVITFTDFESISNQSSRTDIYGLE